jgi:hypothetical protein
MILAMEVRPSSAIAWYGTGNLPSEISPRALRYPSCHFIDDAVHLLQLFTWFFLATDRCLYAARNSSQKLLSNVPDPNALFGVFKFANFH